MIFGPTQLIIAIATRITANCRQKELVNTSWRLASVLNASTNSLSNIIIVRVMKYCSRTEPRIQLVPVLADHSWVQCLRPNLLYRHELETAKMPPARF